MKIIKLKIENYKRGYAILELLFYIALFSILSLLVINAMITMTGSFRETAIHRELVQSGGIMERMSREVRQAYGINTISANDLKLDTKDSDDVNKTVEFLLSGEDVEFFENSVLTGNLNTSSIAVTNLSFTQIITAKGKAVRILLTVKSINDALGRNQDFYDTIVLRGDY